MNHEDKKKFNKELMALAIPLSLQGLLNALVGASDALMLGRLTQDAVAAVSLANQISFIMSLFIGAIVGAVGVLVAQYYGKQDYISAKRFMCMALRYVLVITSIFFLLAFLFPEALMSMFTNEPQLIQIGAKYLKIVSVSYVFSGISSCYLMMMRIGGRVRVSVWISGVTVIVDMVADYFLIYGVGKIPALGASGSAYSTIAVELIACIWCILESYQNDHIRPDHKSMRFFSKQFETDVLMVAFPMLASGLSWGLSISAHSFIMGHLGTDVTAAFSITNVATQLIQCVSLGLANGAGIMLGTLLGQNMLEKAKQYGHRFWFVSLWSGLLNAAMLCIVGPLVYMFYVLEPLAKQYLVVMLVFNVLYMFALAFNAMFTCGVFPAGGDAKYDAISVFFATWCFALPVSIIGCFVFHWPVIVVYIIMCSDEIVKVPFLLPRYRKYIWLKNLTRK